MLLTLTYLFTITARLYSTTLRLQLLQHYYSCYHHYCYRGERHSASELREV
jgi:histidyl-tRNA synthetase